MCTKHPRCRLGPCAAVARPAAAVCVRVDPPRAKVGARWLNPAVAKLCEMGLKKAPKIFACGASFPHRKLRLHDCWTPPTRVLARCAARRQSPWKNMSDGVTTRGQRTRRWKSLHVAIAQRTFGKRRQQLPPMKPCWLVMTSGRPWARRRCADTGWRCLPRWFGWRAWDGVAPPDVSHLILASARGEPSACPSQLVGPSLVVPSLGSVQCSSGEVYPSCSPMPLAQCRVMAGREHSRFKLARMMSQFQKWL